MKHTKIALGILLAAGTVNNTYCRLFKYTSYATYKNDYIALKAYTTNDGFGTKVKDLQGFIQLEPAPGVDYRYFQLNALVYSQKKGKKPVAEDANAVPDLKTGRVKHDQMKKRMAFGFNHKNYRIYCRKLIPVQGELKQLIDLEYGGSFEPEKSEDELLIEAQLPDFIKQRRAGEKLKKKQQVSFFYKGYRYSSADIIKKDGKLYLSAYANIKEYFDITAFSTSQRKYKGKKVEYGLLNMNQ